MTDLQPRPCSPFRVAAGAPRGGCRSVA